MPAVDLLWTYQNTFGDSTAITTITENFNLSPSPNPNDPHLISMINEIKLTATPAAALSIVNYITDSINAYKLTIAGEVFIDFNMPALGTWNNQQNIGPLSLLTKKAGGDVRYEPFNVLSAVPVDITMLWELPVGIAPTGQQVQINQAMNGLAGISDFTGEAGSTVGSLSWQVWGRYGVAEKTFRYGSFQKEIFSAGGQNLPVVLTQQQDMTILGVLLCQEVVQDNLTEAHIRDGAVNQKTIEMLRYINGDYTNYIEIVNFLSTGHNTTNTMSPELFMYTPAAQISGQMWFNTFGWPANTPLTMDVNTAGSTYFLPLYCAPMGSKGSGPVSQQFQQVGNVASRVIEADSTSQQDEVKVSSGSSGASKGGKGYGFFNNRR